jgi:eukaryotic-like serine/threonine-protein kinase
VSLNRPVALKMILAGKLATPTLVHRFHTEAEAVARLDHPHIVPIYEIGEYDGQHYFTMKLIPSGTLADAQQRGLAGHHRRDGRAKSSEQNVPVSISSRSSMDYAARLVSKLARAVHYAHQRGILHRDLKPTNILLDEAGEPHITDFGLAKVADDDSSLTMTAAIVGTPAYMSPEQASGHKGLTTATDIYSLGAILYEFLTGGPPFKAETTLETLRQVREEPPLRLRSLNSAVDRDLETVCLKCLNKDPTRRYASAAMLADDLNRWQKGEPIQARRVTSVEKFRSWCRRKPALAASLLASAFLLLVVAIGSPIAALLIGRERNEAEYQLYLANMNLARQAWDEYNVGLLRRLLDETHSSPHRAFEWYYWQRQAHLATRTLAGHADAVLFVAFSPDGKRILSGSLDQTAKVWDADTGRELFELKRDDATAGLSGPVSFARDGKRVVTGDEEGRVRVWDTATGRELLAFRSHSTAVTCAAFSPNGARLVTGGQDRTVKLWDAASGGNLPTLMGHSGLVSAAAFSPDGLRIVACSDAISSPGTAKVWELASDREPVTFTGHTDGLFCAAFSPDGKRIVTGGRDHTARIWDASTGNELFKLPHSLQVGCVAWSPDGQQVVTGCLDQTARLWDAASGQELRTLKGHSDSVEAVAFSPDGKRIVTGSLDQTVKVWDVDGSEEPLVFREHTDEVWAAAFSPNGKVVVTGSFDATAKVWDAASGKVLLNLTGHKSNVRSIAVSPDGERIATGSWDTTVRIWNAKSGVELRQLEGHSNPVLSLAFSSDGKRLASASSDRTARVWDAGSGEYLFTLAGHTGMVTSVAFSPDGLLIVTGSDDGTAKAWDADSGMEIRTLKGHRGAINSVIFSPNSARIVTGGDRNVAKIWDAATGRELFELPGHSLTLSSIAYSRDGRRIFTGGWDGTAKLWDARTGREILTFKGHNGPVLSVDFDGKSLVTASQDGTARVWRAAKPAQVARWQREDHATAKKLEGLEHEWMAEKQRARAARARDEGRIKRWLILAPIALASGQSGADGLDVEQLPGEASLRPVAGDAVSTANGPLRWREASLDQDYTIDFNALLGRETTQSVAYAVCYIRSHAQQRGLEILVGSDDEAKVYLNGQQVHKHTAGRPFAADDDTAADIKLNAGLNVLVFKVVNETLGWQGSIRFTDPEGNPAKGIKVTLAP